MDRKTAKIIRKRSFARNHDFDNELAGLLDQNEKEYDFLRNPVMQNIYLYQIDYICDFSKEWFNRNYIRMLDWGCGKGEVSYWLKKKGINVTSCDITKTNVTSAFGKINQIITKTGIDVVPLTHEYKLPFENSSFEVVLSFGVLEHVPNDFESLKEINRILTPNGLFFCLYLPYRLSYTQNIEHLRGSWYHNRLYSKSMIKNLLKSADLNLLDLWHRALLPKKSLGSPFFKIIDKIDNWICNYSVLKYLATNIEFVAYKEKW
ncbi:MAG: class I SAM-dependent methyltransferase [Treponema sp.]|jgi:SAM-dependent methyltransferase|nr:class I SAM-dependent methyltransferase [Treponema sp.]